MGDQENYNVEDGITHQEQSVEIHNSKALIKLYVGLLIACSGTLIGLYIFRDFFGFYHWLISSGAFLVCAGYTLYLFFNEPDRLRLFMLHYFAGFAFVLAIPELAAVVIAMNSEASIVRIFKIAPVIGAFYAILITHITGAKPDIIIGRKSFKD